MKNPKKQINKKLRVFRKIMDNTKSLIKAIDEYDNGIINESIKIAKY